MQPFKYGQVIALWLLRLTLVLYLFFGNIHSLGHINFQSIQFYIPLGLILFSVLLLVGGLLSKPGLTVISGLVIFLLSVYKLVISFDGRIDVNLIICLFPLSIGFFFLCQGNK